MLFLRRMGGVLLRSSDAIRLEFTSHDGDIGGCGDAESDPVTSYLEDLDEDALIRILTEPKNALIKQYQKLFEMDEVTLEFREDALRAIAQKAIARKTGARGLRSIMENILMEPMFEIPTAGDIEEVVINADVVDDGAAPLVVHAKKPTSAEKSA